MSAADRGWRYQVATSFLNMDVTTLSDRSASFVVLQSILFGGCLVVLSWPTPFGYVGPLVVSGIAFVGGAFCGLCCLAGWVGARSVVLWRAYLQALEQGTDEDPWQWYRNHDAKPLSGGTEGGGFLRRPPWPTSWIGIPAVFQLVWMATSYYVVARLRFDGTWGAPCVDSLGIDPFGPAMLVYGFGWVVFAIFVGVLVRWLLSRGTQGSGGTTPGK